MLSGWVENETVQGFVAEVGRDEGGFFRAREAGKF